MDQKRLLIQSLLLFQINYLMWANNWTNCPAAGKFLNTMNEISEQTYQFMGMPLMGDGDPNADQVFQVFYGYKDPKLCKSLFKSDEFRRTMCWILGFSCYGS